MQKEKSNPHWKWGGEVPSMPDHASPVASPKLSSAGVPQGSLTCRTGQRSSLNSFGPVMKCRL